MLKGTKTARLISTSVRLSLARSRYMMHLHPVLTGGHCVALANGYYALVEVKDIQQLP